MTISKNYLAYAPSGAGLMCGVAFFEENKGIEGGRPSAGLHRLDKADVICTHAQGFTGTLLIV